MMSTLPMVPGASQQAGFLFRSVWLPLIVTFPTGQSKSTLYVLKIQLYFALSDSNLNISYICSLEMLDKVEPPPIPDGFGISVAYACLLDIVRSISLAVLGPSKVKLYF